MQFKSNPWYRNGYLNTHTAPEVGQQQELLSHAEPEPEGQQVRPVQQIPVAKTTRKDLEGLPSGVDNSNAQKDVCGSKPFEVILMLIISIILYLVVIVSGLCSHLVITISCL